MVLLCPPVRVNGGSAHLGSSVQIGIICWLLDYFLNWEYRIFSIHLPGSPNHMQKWEERWDWFIAYHRGTEACVHLRREDFFFPLERVDNFAKHRFLPFAPFHLPIYNAPIWAGKTFLKKEMDRYGKTERYPSGMATPFVSSPYNQINRQQLSRTLPTNQKSNRKGESDFNV